jgi:tight adherence protein B
VTAAGAIVVGLVATALAIALWPAPNPGTPRFRALVAAGRLADPSPRSRGLRSAEHWWRRPLARPVAVAAVTIGGLVGGGMGLGVGVSAALVALTVWSCLRSIAIRRRQAARDAAVHAGLALVVAELTAGTRPGDALRAATDVAGPFADAFGLVADTIEHGDEMSFAIEDAPPEVAPMMAAVAVATQSGSPLAAVLDRAREDVADRIATSRELTSTLAGARASAAVLAALPVLGVVLGTGLGGAPLAVLFGTSLGHGLLAVGTALTAVGVLWTDRLTRAAERPP